MEVSLIIALCSNIVNAFSLLKIDHFTCIVYTLHAAGGQQRSKGIKSTEDYWML